jgi:hypothetical protein
MKQLRIATIGDYQQWFSYFLMGTAQGTFLNGHLHAAIPIRQQPIHIEEQLKYFKPHIVFCHMIFSENLNDLCGEHIEREHIHQMLAVNRKKLGFKVAYQEGDAKKKPRFPYNASEIIDLGLINSSLYNNYQSILQVPCIHWPYFALNQDEFNTSERKFEYQAIFAGNASIRKEGHLHYGRARFLEDLGRRLTLKIFPDEKIGNTRFCSQEIAQSASAVIGINQGFNVSGYLDTRPFQYIGAGALFFMDPSPSMDLFFEPSVHYAPYKRHDQFDFMEKFEYYTEHHMDKNKEIRKAGFEYVQKWHSAKRRVQMVIDILLNGKEVSDYPIYLKEIVQ